MTHDKFRRAALAKIHIAKTQLAMEDADYRAMLQRVAGVDSAAALTPRQADAVLAEMRRLGFRDPKGQQRTPMPYARAGNEAMMARVMKNLSMSGLTKAYADAMALRMFKIHHIEWLDYENLRKLNAALEINKRRRAKRALPECK